MTYYNEAPSGPPDESEDTVNNKTLSSSNVRYFQRNPQIEILTTSCIRTDGGTQPRAGLNQDVLEDYSEAMAKGALFPPVVVFYDGESHWLADGYHRLEATKRTGVSIITADVRQGTRRDAVLYSVSANAAHGLRRTNADKRRAVMMLLRDEEWCRWTNRAIADTCGVDETLVRKIKSEVSAVKPQIEDEALAKKCGVDVLAVSEARRQVKSLSQELTTRRNGKTYRVNTTQIGKSSKPATAKAASNESKMDASSTTQGQKDNQESVIEAVTCCGDSQQEDQIENSQREETNVVTEAVAHHNQNLENLETSLDNSTSKQENVDESPRSIPHRAFQFLTAEAMEYSYKSPNPKFSEVNEVVNKIASAIKLKDLFLENPLTEVEFRELCETIDEVVPFDWVADWLRNHPQIKQQANKI